jgi:hypothetical protein
MTIKSNGKFTWRLRVMDTLHEDYEFWVLYMKTKSNMYFSWKQRVMGTLYEE